MNEITHNNRIYTTSDITNMRDWLNKYAFCNQATEFVDELTATRVLISIDQFYYGGCIQFSRDHYSMFRPKFMQGYNMAITATNVADKVIVHFILSNRTACITPKQWESYRMKFKDSGMNLLDFTKAP